MPAVERTLSRRVVIIVGLTLVGLITHSTYAGTGDEPHYLAITHSLAFDGDLDLANNYGPNEPLIADGGLQSGGHVHAGRNGILRPMHDVGMPAMLAPYIRLAAPFSAAVADTLPIAVMRRLRLTPSTLYRHILSVLMIFLTCVLASQMLRFSENTTGDSNASTWSALLLALSPPTMILGVLYFAEVISALLIFVVFRHIVVQRVASPLPCAVMGVLTGLLLLVHARNAALALVLAAWGTVRLLREGDVRRASAFLCALAMMFAVRTWLIYTMWGTFFTTPHARFGEWTGWPAVLETAATRLAGLLIDQEFGLLPYAPVLLLAVFGVATLWRHSRHVCIALALLVLAYVGSLVIPMVNVHGWTGGWSPPARFLMPVVPLFAPFLAAGLRRAPRPLAIALVLVQVVISTYAWNRPKDFWNDGDGVAAVCSRGGATFCTLLPSLVTPGDRSRQELQ